MFEVALRLVADNTCKSSYNCSGHGMCHDGICLCEVQFSGGTCADANMRYFISFSAVFYFLSFVSLIQLCMCIREDMMKCSTTSALRVTSQKLLYIFVIIATAIRGIYFSTKNTIRVETASMLLTAYYPFVLSGVSLVVCLWAEAFHLIDLQLDRPRFLSKSLVTFAVFNVFVYCLLAAEFIATELITDAEIQGLLKTMVNSIFAFLMFVSVICFLIYGVETYFRVHGAWSSRGITKSVNSIQLHMSRLGLISQAGLQLFIVLFLVFDILGDKWKKDLEIRGRNVYDIAFRVAEIGVALWFPCCLWNWRSPEQLWILNPKKILKQLEKSEISETECLLRKRHLNYQSTSSTGSSTISKECWICYDNDRQDAGPLIQPCACKGDVAAVHHECLRRWLTESSRSLDKGLLYCKVCAQKYNVRTGYLCVPRTFSIKNWLQSVFLIFVMVAAPVSAVVVMQHLETTFLQILAAGLSALLEYICLRLLGFSLINAYTRAKVAAMVILGKEVVESEPAPSVDDDSMEVPVDINVCGERNAEL